ncbi:sensor histidine kinase [Haloferula chungangensis]|uniref:histidine kinase n=1 Tax=Haloferula chungangensis TaxID=1048331 RepID=A0ABW2L8U8_9BACT
MSKTPPNPAIDPRSRGGLFRRFIVPQVLIATAAGALALLWAASQQRQQAHERLAEVAEANALFLTNLKLPRSWQLADSLSQVTNSKVAFFLPDEGLVVGHGWTTEERAVAALARELEPTLARIGEHHALMRAIPDGRGSIVVVEPVGPLFDFSRSSSLVPLLGMTLLAVAAAFLIARSVVRPLQTLAEHGFSAPAEKGHELPARLTARHDEIGILARTLEQQRSELLDEQARRRNSEKMALLGQLATSLAHEIKNPAAAIIMHARNLEAQQDRGEGRLIREEGEHITALVNQWLFVAKPKAPRSSETDLVQLLRSLKSRLAPLLDFHRCRLELQLPESLIISCDTQRLEQVFRNLIDNAIKAMPEGGTVTLEMEQTDESSVVFHVLDEGPGFSAQALAHFGETFYSEREGGMGLGLALASGVVRAQGGTLTARNLKDGGACVTGTLNTRPI